MQSNLNLQPFLHEGSFCLGKIEVENGLEIIKVTRSIRRLEHCQSVELTTFVGRLNKSACGVKLF